MRAALILVATLYAPTHAFSVSWVRSGPGMRMRAARMVSDETVASIFAEFDADNSGFIDVGELQAALASGGGGLANAAVVRLLEVGAAAEGPTNKWEAIKTVMVLLEKVGAAAGAVEQASLQNILQTWNGSAGTENAVLLQVCPRCHQR